MTLLRTGCTLSPRSPQDGVRVSVMSRHTLEDGKTPDQRIVAGVSFDEWRPGLAAQAHLVGAWYRGQVTWEAYARQYLAFLRSEAHAPCVAAFARVCMHEVHTLLCVEESPEHCHRKLLAEEMARINPKLKVEIA